VAVNGFTKAPYIMVVTTQKLGLDAFVGDNSETDFTLSNAATYYAAGGVEVYFDGVHQAAGYTVSAGVLTFTPAPGTGVKIIVEYQFD